MSEDLLSVDDLTRAIDQLDLQLDLLLCSARVPTIRGGELLARVPWREASQEGRQLAAASARGPVRLAAVWIEGELYLEICAAAPRPPSEDDRPMRGGGWAPWYDDRWPP